MACLGEPQKHEPERRGRKRDKPAGTIGQDNGGREVKHQEADTEQELGARA